MKKKIFLLPVLAIAMLSNTFANENKQGPEQVASNFNKEFAQAKETNIVKFGDSYKISFKWNNDLMQAFYNNNGELLGVSRNLVLTQLPFTLQRVLTNDYKSYWISELFEMSSNDGTTYYVTIENADQKLILKSTDGANWDNYNKFKK